MDISTYHKNTSWETLMLIKTYILTQIIVAWLLNTYNYFIIMGCY